MKRNFLFFGTLLFVASAFCFVACSSGDDSDGNNTISSNTTPVVDESVSYTITFDTSNFAVTSESDQTVTSVSSVTKYKNAQFTSADLPTVTVKSGYKLAGWYMDAAHTQAFSSFYATENVRLYAKFATEAGVDVPNYVITYESEYDVAKPKTTSGLLTSLHVPRFTGYDKLFCGWFHDSNYTNQAIFGDTVDKDTTLYAKWLLPGTVSPGSGAIFADHEFPEELDLYTRTTGEKDPDIGTYAYTKATEFSSTSTSINTYIAPGLWNFDGVVLYSTYFDYMGLKGKNSKSTLLNFGSSRNNLEVPNLVGGAVDMKKLEAFVAVKATGAGTVSASIKKGANTDKNSSFAGVVALVNENGTVLAAIKNDDKEKATLSADVTSLGNIYLVFSRNGDDGGMLYVESMKFTAAE